MERKIGEIFQDGDVTLKVVENDVESCILNKDEKTEKLCFYLYEDSEACPEDQCSCFKRQDKKSVIFIKQDQP